MINLKTELLKTAHRNIEEALEKEAFFLGAAAKTVGKGIGKVFGRSAGVSARRVVHNAGRVISKAGTAASGKMFGRAAPAVNWAARTTYKTGVKVAKTLPGTIKSVGKGSVKVGKVALSKPGWIAGGAISGAVSSKAWKTPNF